MQNNGKAVPCFSKSHDNELWVMILEKVWAKMHGSYANIISGNAQECLHDLTGGPTKYLQIDNEDQDNIQFIWEQILNGDRKDFIMSCSSKQDKTGTVEAESELGIIGGHAYTLIACHELTIEGRQVRLVKIRNPWGDHEWKGPWSDGSTQWNLIDSNTKSQLISQQEQQSQYEDGIFFMQFEDFINHYRSIQICMCYDSFKYNFIKVESTNKRGKLFKIQIKTKGQYYFTVNQTSERKYPQEVQQNFEYSLVKICLAKLENNNELKFIEDNYENYREVWTTKGENQLLEAGIYYFYAKVQWNISQQDSFVLSSYGQDDVQLKLTNDFTNNTFLQKVYLNHAEVFKKKLTTNVEQAYQISDGHQYIAIFNNNPVIQDQPNHKLFQITCVIKNVNGDIKLKKPYKNQNYQCQLKIPAGQSRIILGSFKGWNCGFGVEFKDYKYC